MRPLDCALIAALIAVVIIYGFTRTPDPPTIFPSAQTAPGLCMADGKVWPARHTSLGNWCLMRDEP